MTKRGPRSAKSEQELSKERAEREENAVRRKGFGRMVTDGRYYRPLSMDQLLKAQEVVSEAIKRKKAKEIKELEDKIARLKGK